MNSVKYYAPIGNSGYAEAAKDYMLSLHETGAIVCAKYLNFGNPAKIGNDRREMVIAGLIQNKAQYDNVLVHSTPDHWGGVIGTEKGKRVIGMTVWETTELHPSWIPWVNGAQSVIVPCYWNKRVFHESGITRPIYVVPHILKEQRSVKGDILGTEGKYVFYTIGQWHSRKGVADTIRAYLMAFSADDDVCLVVKTFLHSFDESDKTIIKKEVCRLMSEFASPPNVTLVLDEMTQDQMDAIHTKGDCYVSMCKAEGWGLGAFDAAGRGKPVVMTGFGGQMDFLKKGNHRLVDYETVAVKGMPWINVYNESMSWAQPDLEHGSKLLREVYNKRFGVSHSQKNWMKATFSSNVVAKQINQILEG